MKGNYHEKEKNNKIKVLLLATLLLSNVLNLTDAYKHYVNPKGYKIKTIEGRIKETNIH